MFVLLSCTPVRRPCAVRQQSFVETAGVPPIGRIIDRLRGIERRIAASLRFRPGPPVLDALPAAMEKPLLPAP